MTSPSVIEVATYPHLGDDFAKVFLALFTNVNNASEVRSRIIAAATVDGHHGDQERERINFAFIDAKTIVSREHLLAAIMVAIVAASHGSLTTKTVHSEVLWALNYSNNISESIKRFGVGNSSTSVIVVRVGDINPLDPKGPRLSATEITQMMKAVVQGQLTSLDDVPEVTDIPLVKKYYKLNADPAIVRLGTKVPRELSATPPRAVLDEERRLVNEIVTSSVAMKTVLA
ncbi:hypothetical protein FRB95_013371 [Tulasnella sp. JGI-2019a]|nr:hypothetical protein FRB93_001052 [Tulasnella sp. JGI-2019a]KAG9034335.1 hypothetical protein FRB95_013371 [Tulasnella sp. JGI-2019a]